MGKMGILIILGSMVLAGLIGQPGLIVLGLIIGIAVMANQSKGR